MDELPSPSEWDLVDGAEAPAAVIPSWPEDRQYMMPVMDDFWDLGDLPRGSGLTFALEGKDSEPPCTMAVLVLACTVGPEGMLVKCRFVGSSEAWGRETGIASIARKKGMIHICRDEGPAGCSVDAPFHFTEFDFWPVGKLDVPFADKRVMKDVQKIWKEEAEKLAAPPVGKPRENAVGDSATDRLATLRQKLVAQRMSSPASLSAGKSVHWDPQVAEHAPMGILKRLGKESSPQGAVHYISSGDECVQAEASPKKKRRTSVGTALVQAAQVHQGMVPASSSKAAVVHVKKEAETGPSQKKRKKKKKKKKKDKKDGSNSSSDYPDESSSSSELLPPLQRKSEKRPGSVLKLLMDHVRLALSDMSAVGAGGRGASSSVTSAARIQSYFQILVRPHLQSRPRDEKELHALALALDCLRDGNVERVADILAGRYLSVETAAFDGSWDAARWLEVAPLEDRGAVNTQTLLQARKHQRLVEKASGKGSYPRPSGNYWASAPGGGNNSGRTDWQNTGGGKGKGKKGKPKGNEKGKNAWKKDGPGKGHEREAHENNK